MSTHYGLNPYMDQTDAGRLSIATTTIPQTGLACLLDAGISSSYSGTGNTWYDISGNSRHFNWYSTPVYTPTAGSAYFKVLGNLGTGPASNSFGITNTSGYTILFAMKQITLATSGAFQFYSSNGAAGTAQARGLFSHCSWSDGEVYFDQGGCCGTDTRISVVSSTTNWNVWGFRRLANSSTRDIFKNGVSLVQSSATAVDINLNAVPATIGSTAEVSAIGASTWDSIIGCFIVYNRGLTNIEMKNVSGVYQKRYQS